ncbi:MULTISPECIES: ScbA/BarX family gamma-butyrolactone biosynthesis protein [Streptomyces]|uniref:ScbA/BarX family gamma-butyrolactone biosynthesis protein n=1 Tax=Streptomyces TaxID=1883 RepID=UPI0022488672|nr:ScbA/BarX family gamma-butyrolactone biosynthesis protein [Streptomyces sp. JHD 1]MCX2969368.1 ScbA/BarX family gamma-butyrolactone biosynthesis protein [Streptomyces sp. JHD 1]
MDTGTARTPTPAVTPPPDPALGGYVRKSEPAEVFVRAWHTVSAHTHVVTLSWPRAHAFYTLDSGLTSPLLFTESVRQALAVLSHTVHEIPLGHRLGWEYVHSTVTTAALRDGARAPAVELRVTHTGVTRRRGGSVHLTAHVTGTRDGDPLGTAEIRYTTHPPAIYDRLRREYADARRAFANALPLPAPVAPSLVGRADPRDVVIAPTATRHRYQLRTDTAHSVLFDHPHDHVPGMVLLEAVSQAAQAEARPRRVLPVDFDSTFSRYVEFDAPCWLDVRPEPRDPSGRERVRVRGTQNDQEVFSSLTVLDPRTR